MRPACLFLLVILAAAPAAWTADYHVATDGSNGNPGTLALPWATLQHAADNVGPADRVLVHEGTYVGARIEISGLPQAYITLRSAPGEAVLVDGPGPDNQHDSTLEIETWSGSGVVAYWAIEDLEIRGGDRSGIDIRNAHHVTARGNRVHSSGLTGIFSGFADDLLIEENESFANGEHGIYVSNSGDRPVIRGNYLYDNFAAGIHMNGDLSQGGDGIISAAVVESNVIRGNGVGGASGINMDGVVQSRVVNNLVFDEHASGISLYQQDGAVCSSDNLVAHNTVLIAADGRWALNMPDPGCTGNRLANNVFYTEHSWRGSIAIWGPAPAGFASDHNAVMDRFSVDGGDTRLTFSEWQSLGYGQESFLATPVELFEDPAGGDYHLPATSPAVDAGLTLSEVPDDIEGALRPQGVSSDVGCYERGGIFFSDGFESGDTSAWSGSR